MNDSTLARIRGLLAKAESTEFPEEAESFRAKAAELAAKYNIEQAQIDAARKDHNLGAIDGLRVTYAGAYTKEKANLFGSIAQAFGMQVIDTAYRGRALSSVAYGFPAKRQVVELLYTSLLIQSDQELRREQPPAWYDRGEKITWRRSWLAGFAHRIQQRLRDERQRQAAEHDRQQPEGASTALVLADRRTAVKRWFENQFSDMETAKPRKTNIDQRALIQGAMAGDRADIGGAKLGGKEAKQITHR